MHHHGPSRRATFTTVGAVAVVALLVGAFLRWGPDPAAVQEPAAADTTTSAVRSETPEPSPGQTLTPSPDAQLAAMIAARASVPDDEILRQLRNTAERIAKREPMITPPPQPADVSAGSNRGLGYHLMLEFGFAADQWPALDALWHRESGWNHLAENPSSGAYGIPQSLPANKMAVVGSDWRTNPETQIRWGLAYIAARYGVPDRAWAHSERHGWY